VAWQASQAVRTRSRSWRRASFRQAASAPSGGPGWSVPAIWRRASWWGRPSSPHRRRRLAPRTPSPPRQGAAGCYIEPACPRRPSGLSLQPSTAAGSLGSSSRRCPLHDHPVLLAEPALPKRARSRPRQPPPVSSRAQALTVAQKSGFCAVGTSEYAPGYHSGFSAQTSSGHSSKARRNVTVADQGIVKTPASSTVSWDAVSFLRRQWLLSHQRDRALG